MFRHVSLLVLQLLSLASFVLACKADIVLPTGRFFGRQGAWAWAGGGGRGGEEVGHFAAIPVLLNIQAVTDSSECFHTVTFRASIVILLFRSGSKYSMVMVSAL